MNLYGLVASTLEFPVKNPESVVDTLDAFEGALVQFLAGLEVFEEFAEIAG